MASTCSRCQALLATDVLEGLCPRCLLAQALPLEPIAETTPHAHRFTAPTPGQLAPLFSQLEILELLGQGGMGAVYKARQIKLDRIVALKILPPSVAEGPGFAERFTREARALARLTHPHIVTVHDFGDVDGLYYLIMEFVEGVDLRKALAGGKLAPAQALGVVAELCSALQYAHEMGVVHRDIKPENVLLDRLGRVKVADFGLAKMIGQTQAAARLTGTEQVMGTMHYMAPEQWEKPAEVDHRADIYSLGVVFYELLTGELPLGKFALPSEKVEVDARLDGVVLRAMEKEPEQRYQHMSQMRTDVEAVGHDEIGGAKPEPGSSGGRFANQSLIMAALLILVPGSLMGYFQTHRDIPTTYYLLLGLAFWLVLLLAESRHVRRFVALGLCGTAGALLLRYFTNNTSFDWLAFACMGVCFFALGCFIETYVQKEGEEVGEKDGDEQQATKLERFQAGLSDKERALWDLCGRNAGQGDALYYLSMAPDIDTDMLRNARIHAEVEPDDRILAILDFGGGEGETALVFGGRALYWCNSDETECPGAGTMPYAVMNGRRFINHGDAVYLGEDSYICPTPDDSGIDCEVLAGFLEEVKRTMTRAGEGGSAPR